MSTNFIISILMTFLSVFPIFAQESLSKYEVDTYGFKSSIVKQMKATLCREDQKFLTCYQLSEEKCMADVNDIINSCFDKVMKPGKINLATESDLIVNKVSKCLGKNYHEKNKKKFSKHKSCLEPE